jgi:hypothetical protein
MRGLERLLLLYVVTGAAAVASVVAAPDGLADARAARAMLGGLIWSRLVRIENTAPHEGWHRSAYPRVVYAVVFEVSGILWFYTATDGTQSLSLTRGTAARDEADPGALFRAIDPGFTGWSWIEAKGAREPAVPRHPANACFIESLAVLLRRLETGEEAGSPRLLSFYVKTPTVLYGHTVLVFDTAKGLEAVDPGISEEPVEIPREVGTDPMALSAFLRGGRVSSARALYVTCARALPAPPLCSTAAEPRVGAG